MIGALSNDPARFVDLGFWISDFEKQRGTGVQVEFPRNKPQHFDLGIEYSASHNPPLLAIDLYD